MLKFEKIMEIRRMYYGDHVAVTDIAEKTGSSVNTIKKYLDITDFSISPPLPISDEVICPKLERWKPLIDLWLTKDLNMPRKQRHTALRVYERLREADTDFNCSYRTVCTYVRYMRNELGQAKDDGHLPLVHFPGECQGDFGEAVFIENGIRKTGKFFVLDFPYSNCGFAQLKYGRFKVRHIVIPMAKVEYVSTSQGPFLRKYGLFNVEIGTTTSDHTIPAIHRDEAYALREQISTYAKVKLDGENGVEEA